MVAPLASGLFVMTTALPSNPTLTFATITVVVLLPIFSCRVIVMVFPANCFPTFTVTAVFPEADLTAETLGLVAALALDNPTTLIPIARIPVSTTRAILLEPNKGTEVRAWVFMNSSQLEVMCEEWLLIMWP